MTIQSDKKTIIAAAKRFRGFLPVVVDVETGGFNAETDALLEIALVLLDLDKDGQWYPKKTLAHHLKPFPKAHIDPAALAFNKIDPDHPFRFAITEKEALNELFQGVKTAVQEARCTRAVLVGHNAWFDLSFVNAAIERNHIKKSPFHRFTSLDTASLSALIYGQTVLAKALAAANIPFDSQQAHSAIYDAEKTADLFCKIVNEYAFSVPTKG